MGDAKSNRLKTDQKCLIVQMVARFATPSEIVEAVNLEFGIDVSPQTVMKYDPTKVSGQNLSKDLRALFDEARAAYIAHLSQHGIAHESYRLERLQRMAADAEKRKNYAMAAQLLEQAAKERGGIYTNRREVKIEDKRQALAALLGVQPEQLPVEETVH